MNTHYIVKNQHGQYISKQKEWLDGSDPKLLYRTPHKDEALNIVFELSSKDIYLRAEAVTCELDDKNHPIVEVTYIEPDLLTDTLENALPEESDLEAATSFT